jgi:hypothetical protein
VSGDEKGTESVERGESWTGYQVAKKWLYLSLRLIGTLSYTLGITADPNERAYLGISLQQLA